MHLDSTFLGVHLDSTFLGVHLDSTFLGVHLDSTSLGVIWIARRCRNSSGRLGLDLRCYSDFDLFILFIFIFVMGVN